MLCEGEIEGSDATAADEEPGITVGVVGIALIASEGIRIPGVTFGETGKS